MGDIAIDVRYEPSHEATTVATAPACPAWCTETHDVDGWDYVGRDTVKVCAQDFVSRDGLDRVTVQRFADLNDGRIAVAPVVVRVDVAEALTPTEARELAGQLIAAADLGESTG